MQRMIQQAQKRSSSSLAKKQATKCAQSAKPSASPTPRNLLDWPKAGARKK